MDAKLPDEIVCPICGRPNKKNAVRCWFCQIEFEKKDAYPQQTSLLKDPVEGEENAGKSSFIQSSVEPNHNNNHEDIPEWLKRIRELQAAEEQEENKEESWHQDSFLDEETDPAEDEQGEKIVNYPSESGKKNPIEKPVNEKQVSLNQEKDVLENESDNLPEGFTKLSLSDEN